MVREIVSTITSKGQITVPVDVRRHLGLGVGDKLVFLIGEDGTVRVMLATYPDIELLRGIAGCMKTPMSWEEVEERIEEEIAAEVAGKLR